MNRKRMSLTGVLYFSETRTEIAIVKLEEKATAADGTGWAGSGSSIAIAKAFGKG